MTTPHVLVYTRDGCPYCTRAKMLLASKGVAFEERNASVDPAYRAEMMKVSGGTTFPQIFIGATHVGGCDDMYSLEAAGELDPLLAGKD